MGLLQGRHWAPVPPGPPPGSRSCEAGGGRGEAWERVKVGHVEVCLMQQVQASDLPRPRPPASLTSKLIFFVGPQRCAHGQTLHQSQAHTHTHAHKGRQRRKLTGGRRFKGLQIQGRTPCKGSHWRLLAQKRQTERSKLNFRTDLQVVKLCSSHSAPQQNPCIPRTSSRLPSSGCHRCWPGCCCVHEKGREGRKGRKFVESIRRV